MTSREPPASSEGLVAFGDESASVRRIDPDVYLLAAIVLEPARISEVREQARTLLLPGQSKVHWRHDSARRHDAVVDAIVLMEITSMVVVREGPTGERDERRRRKSLERLVHELEQCGCTHLTLESRGPTDDSRDRQLLDSMRARAASSVLRLDHQVGPSEPMLWVADAICGAIVAARTGEARWSRILAARMRVIEIDRRSRR